MKIPVKVKEPWKHFDVPEVIVLFDYLNIIFFHLGKGNICHKSEERKTDRPKEHQEKEI